VASLMARVVQLGGEPLAGPSEAAHRSYTDYRQAPKDPSDLRTMLADSLAGERAAITYYRNLFESTRETDPVTAELARHALIDEIEDEDELERLLAGWPER
jgi:ferritin-like protein